jgi:hypothetical protein
MALLALTAAVGAFSANAATAADLRLPGEPAPRLARIFTPQHVRGAVYEVTVLAESLDRAVQHVRATLAPGFSLGTPPGAWQAQALDPLEAFGRAGTYDRSRVAQLYAGRRVSVVRGPIERDGRVEGALTLLSPYPDPTLTRLEPGTLAILLKTGR